MKRKILLILPLLLIAAAILTNNAPRELEGEYILTENGEHYLLSDLAWETDAFQLINISDNPKLLDGLESGDRVRVTVAEIQSSTREQTAYITKCQKISAK